MYTPDWNRSQKFEAILRMMERDVLDFADGSLVPKGFHSSDPFKPKVFTMKVSFSPRNHQSPKSDNFELKQKSLFFVQIVAFEASNCQGLLSTAYNTKTPRFDYRYCWL